MTRGDYNRFRTLQAQKNKADLVEFKKMLKSFDWHWRMSDSPKKRENGYQEEQRIQSFLIGRGKTFHTLYQKEFNKVYKKKK